MHPDSALYSHQQLQAAGDLLPERQASWLKEKRHDEFFSLRAEQKSSFQHSEEMEMYPSLPQT